MTRVTHRTIQDSTLANLQRNLTAMSGLQEQLSTGKRINRPSDDPTGAVSVLQVRADLRSSEQYSRNASDGLGWLGSVDTALQSTSSQLRRARDLTVQGLNDGALGQASRKAIALELQGIKDAVLGLANTKYLGRSVFAGTTDARQAYTANADGTYTYADTGAGINAANGGGTVDRRVAAEAAVRVDSDGRAVFGPAGDSVFTLLDDIATQVAAGDTADLETSLGKLDGFLTSTLNELSSVGSRYARIEGAKQAAEDAVLTLQTSLSDVESIDLPKTIVNLQMQEVAYKAALGATAKVLQPSLLDFIR
jgi:flagellar hook-associated protein 3 FlgL